MQYFPLFLNLNDKPVLVVGGGEVACRKVDALIRAGALVTIVSPKIEPYLLELVEQKRCQWVQNFYSSELLTNDYLQVWATTDNPSLNHQVHKDAKNSRILVNVVDDQPYCDFITPSMIERGRIQIAISSGGASPVLVRNIRETLEAVLPQNLSLLADFGSSKRNSIKQSLASVSERRKFWEEFLAEPKVENAKNREDLEALYQQALKQPIDNEGQCTWINFGDDVELLPIKALRYMQRAEVVFFEENCPFEFIDLVRRDAERESFQDAAQLAEKLNQARAEKRRICVLMPKQATDYTLLIGADLTL
ncbi:precorrin-2 dehydrogenase/sirohydrochlorin ferrochelatase family protein [Vibrio aestuarianus]|uniref:precorrin-2 dehydrogenase n=1 Tax=Vibrio aestuarianus TaxID=28171 RepID=A0ABD7YPS7_9VIBR|nr:bifunctional precorrin-2 dehydrogenase/sirohydrochlorin ferrochelatase [Vibrio aestuarianus]KOE80850.1 ferrochelatase [Vibrio alginolyticus]MDE1213048.1 siroheme synthase [Vibrio aestuarianus]MDE1216968.1 siroheme synthase [Vibrio aestuarianus]MDE1228324.1 siroheme synthase [Vibrio aestuarianus]MDE1232495.1 siroheme synthase [Vibrio aestuarianus]